MQLTNRMTAWIVVASLLIGSAAGDIATPRLRSSALKPKLALDQELSLGVSLLDEHRETGSNVTDVPTLNDIENVLNQIQADKKNGKATPGMDGFVRTVTRMIDREMVPAIRKQHRAARIMLWRFKIGFIKCGNIRKRSRGRITSLKTTKYSARKYHKSCRGVEQKRYVVKAACQKIVAEKLKAKRVACNAFRAFQKDPNTEASTCHTTASAEPYGLWLTRNRKFFLGKIREYRRLRINCISASRKWRRAYIPCWRKTRRYDWRKRRCNRFQYRLETSSCSLAKRIKDTCTSYSSCYDRNLALYKKMKPKLMVQEKDRKGEWRALMRIKCLLQGVFGDKQEDGDDSSSNMINKCKGKTHSTRHLNLRYPRVPNKFDCEKTPPIPGEKNFKSVEYVPLQFPYPNVKPRRSIQCVLNPGGGIIMGLFKKLRKDKCRVENGWLLAQNGGSCMLARKYGQPVVVDYTKRRFTRYTFTVKMDEVNTRDGQSGGGGFSVCNKVYASSVANGKDPMISFQDTKSPVTWGYHLSGGFVGAPNRGAAKCKDLLVNYKVWGRSGRGIDVSKYTNGKMKWIGCMGDGCSARSFFCNDMQDGIVFGSPGTLRGLLGNKVPKRHKGCCSRRNPDSVCNAMDKTKDINKLCRDLGYTRGTILAARKSNWCPEVSYEKGGWSSDFVNSNGYGNKFRCQGSTAPKMYTSKKYYKAAEPKAGAEKRWDLVMEWRGGKYSVRSLKIEGVDFSGYRGTKTTCPATNKKWGMVPRIGAFKTGKMYIKDFKVFQGNRFRKMKQIVGQGVTRGKKVQKKRLVRAAIRAARRISRCSSRVRSPWLTRNMYVFRGRYFYKKWRGVRRGWNAWAIQRGVTAVKYRIISRHYGRRQTHVRVGLTPSHRQDLHFRGGKVFSIYPGGRLYISGYGRRRWRYGHTVAIRIIGRRYCAYHNGRRLRCWRNAPRSGKAYAQVHMYEPRARVQLRSLCTMSKR